MPEIPAMRGDSYQVRIVNKKDLSMTDSLRLEMISVLSHLYRNPQSVIDRRFHSSDYIFLLYRENELHGFSTCTFMDLLTQEGRKPAAYLGIMAASQAIQGKGIILKAMETMVETIRLEQSKRKAGLIVWCTTASPSSVSLFRRYFTGVSPDTDGRLLPAHRAAAGAMKEYLLQDKPDTAQHPLVIRDLLPQSAYSDKEDKRIRAIHDRIPGDIVKSLEINHERGDRMILIGEMT